DECAHIGYWLALLLVHAPPLWNYWNFDQITREQAHHRGRSSIACALGLLSEFIQRNLRVGTPGIEHTPVKFDIGKLCFEDGHDLLNGFVSLLRREAFASRQVADGSERFGHLVGQCKRVNGDTLLFGQAGDAFDSFSTRTAAWESITTHAHAMWGSITHQD